MSIHDEVRLIPWQEEWEVSFQAEKDRISAALREYPANIYHVGSTSVKGMISKPIIDILVCPTSHLSSEGHHRHTGAVEQIDDQRGDAVEQKYITALERIGYKNHGECGREIVRYEIGKLVNYLWKKGRSADAERLVMDENYREEMLEKLRKGEFDSDTIPADTLPADGH